MISQRDSSIFGLISCWESAKIPSNPSQIVDVKLASSARATSLLRVSIKASIKARCFPSFKQAQITVSSFSSGAAPRRLAVKRRAPPLKLGCFPQDVAEAGNPDGQKDFHR